MPARDAADLHALGRHTVKLRPYQRGAIDKVRSVWDSGQPNALIVLPTGSGKTVVFAALGREFRMEMDDGGRVLVLAHRTELIEQARDKWLKVEPDATVGIYQGSKREVWADVICASVQSCYPDKRADGECDCVTTSAIGGVAVKDPANGCIVCGGTGIVKDRLVRKGRIHDLPLAKIGAALPARVAIIFGWCSEEQMCRVHACRHVAPMTDVHSFWDCRAPKQDPRNAMSTPDFVLYMQRAISILKRSSDPQPAARVRFRFDVSPESFGDRNNRTRIDASRH